MVCSLENLYGKELHTPARAADSQNEGCPNDFFEKCCHVVFAASLPNEEKCLTVAQTNEVLN